MSGGAGPTREAREDGQRGGHLLLIRRGQGRAADSDGPGCSFRVN